MYSVNAMAKLMTVLLIFSVVFISCGGEVTTDTEPEEEPGISPTAFSCNNDADCELTDERLVTSTEGCCGCLGCEPEVVNHEEVQMRIETYEEYCSEIDCSHLDCPDLSCAGCPSDTPRLVAKCVNNVCQGTGGLIEL